MAAMTDVRYELKLVVEKEPLDTFIERLARSVEGRAWPPVRGIASPPAVSGKLKRPPADSVSALLADVKGFAKKPENVLLGFSETSGIRWGQRPDGNSIHLSVGFDLADKLFPEPAECVRALTHVARHMLRGGSVASAAVERTGDSGACVPLVPLAKTRRPLVLTSDAEVAAEYERPDDFWSAGWTIEEFGERKLLTRCQDVVSTGDILRATQDHQWQMARAAKPKRTAYSTPIIEPDERPIYEEGDARIQPVGLVTKTRTAHYACVLDPGEHVRGFEIYYLRSLVQNHRMQDGTPVENVRVEFQRQAMAESERRPLLDNGIEVCYRDHDTGDLVPLTT